MWRVIVGWWGQPLRALEKQGQTNIVVCTSVELDLTNQRAVREFLTTEQPDQVYLAAAKVGVSMLTIYVQPHLFMRTS